MDYESIILNKAVEGVFNKIRNKETLNANDNELLMYASQMLANQVVDIIPGFGGMARGKYAAKTARKLAAETEALLNKPEVVEVVKKLYNTPVAQKVASVVDDAAVATSNVFKPIYDDASRYASKLLQPNKLPGQLRASNVINQAYGNTIANTAQSLDDIIGNTIKAGGVLGVAGGGNLLLNGINNSMPAGNAGGNDYNSHTQYGPRTEAPNLLPGESLDIDRAIQSGRAEEVVANEIMTKAVNVVQAKIANKQPLSQHEAALYKSLVPLESPSPYPMPRMAETQQYPNESTASGILYNPPAPPGSSKLAGPSLNSLPEIKWSTKATDYINRSTGLSLSHDDRLGFGLEMFGPAYRGTLDQNNQIINKLKSMRAKSDGYENQTPYSGFRTIASEI